MPARNAVDVGIPPRLSQQTDTGAVLAALSDVWCRSVSASVEFATCVCILAPCQPSFGDHNCLLRFALEIRFVCCLKAEEPTSKPVSSLVRFVCCLKAEKPTSKPMSSLVRFVCCLKAEKPTSKPVSSLVRFVRCLKTEKPTSEQSCKICVLSED